MEVDEEAKKKRTQRPGFDEPWPNMGIAALAFFFFWPLGLFLLWRTRRYRTPLSRQDWLHLLGLLGVFVGLTLLRTLFSVPT